MKQVVKSSFPSSLHTAALVVAAAIALGLVCSRNRQYHTHNDSIDTYRCHPKQFSPMILSTDPLLIHIDEFVTPFEAEYLISLA